MKANNTTLATTTAETANSHSLHNTFTQTLAAIVLTLLLFTTAALAQKTYVITGTGAGNTTPFTATDGAGFTTSNAAILTVINSIKTDAAGTPCTIQFENLTNTLNIGTSYITFDGSGTPTWGLITLTGKLTSATTGVGRGTIIMSNDVSVESKADIANTAAYAAVVNQSARALTISGGTISATTGAAISNQSTGAVNISGGTISATTGYAVQQSSTGKITVSGTAKITSERTSYGTIYFQDNVTATDDLLVIEDGLVENTATNGNAIYNASTGGAVSISGGTISATTGTAVYNYSTGAVSISGGTVSVTTGSAVYNRSTGAVSISGGTISATTGVAVHNQSAGKITVSGTAEITSANVTSAQGTIILANGSSTTTERLVIEGGTVKNTAFNSGNAHVINNSSAGVVTISGGTVQTDVMNGHAVYNQSTGAVNISGGTILANSYAVYNQSSTGTVTISGGTISSPGGIAVYRPSIGDVNISGGTISTVAGVAVYNRTIGTTGAVNISGGTISATGGSGVAIINENIGKIIVSGTAKITSVNTSANSLQAAQGTIFVNGTATEERLVIEGGTVENTAANANAHTIYNSSAGVVTISGGTVSAKDGYAIYKSGTGATTITDGAVFAYGTATNNVIYGTYDAASGEPAIIAWNKAAGNTEYTAFESDDIFALAPATAQWLNKGDKAGIDYANGSNTGFIELPVTVNKATPTGITFPTASGITYNPSTTLSQIALTGGTGDGTFAWQNGTTVPTVTNSSYNVAFTPTDTENYDYTGITLIQSVALTVAKANPTYTAPTGLTATADKTLADVTLPSGWAWESALTTAVGNAGTQTHKAKFTPTDTDNYNVITGIDLQVTVSEPTPIRTPQIASSNIFAYAMGNNIVLQNLPSGAKVEVFGLNGKLVYSNRENPSIGGIGVQTIPMQTKGMYVVKVSRGVSHTPNTNTFRVAVK
jgi:hypothetical protein